jgi:hypothetical protein
VTAPRRFFFCHLQKTGGTSAIRMLRRHFGDDRVYPNRSDGDTAAAVISIPHLIARWAARGHEIELITGHFPLCARELLGVPFTTFTILREPIDRTLSYLRHHQRLTPADRGKTLEQIYDTRFRFHGLIHNHMVKMLSLTVDEMRGGALTPVAFSPERLARAKATLRAIDVVGVLDRFEDFCDQLQDRYGFRLGAPVVVNRTARTPVDEAFRERIARDNAQDVELYQMARGLVQEQVDRRLARPMALDA